MRPRNGLYSLILLTLLLIAAGCAGHHKKVERLDNKLICMKSSGQDLRCMTTNTAYDTARVLYGEDRAYLIAERFNNLIDKQGTLGEALGREEAIQGCEFNGSWHAVGLENTESAYLLSIADTGIENLEQSLTDPQMDKLLEPCNRDAEEATQGISMDDEGYARAVDRTKQRLTEGMKDCWQNPGNSLMAIWQIPKMFSWFYKAAKGREDALKGGEDAFSGKEPTQKMTDLLGADTPYGQSYKNALKAMCSNGRPKACNKLKELEENPDPEPAPDPEPTPELEPEPEPDPAPEQGTATSCVEGTRCGSNCAAAKQWWDEFIEGCDARGWRTYDCQSLVAAINNCVDPATVRPMPDGDWNCSPPLTEEEARQTFKVFACEEKGKVAHPGPEGENLICSDRSVTAVTTEEAFRLHMQKQCLYMYTDQGLCSTGEPSGSPFVVEGVDLPGPGGHEPGPGGGQPIPFDPNDPDRPY